MWNFFLFLAAMSAGSAVYAEPILITIDSYSGLADSPFQPAYFEDFEDGEFDIPGLSVEVFLTPVYPPVVRSSSESARAVETDGHSFGPIAEFVHPIAPQQEHGSYLHFHFDESVPTEMRSSFGFALTHIPSEAIFTIDVYGEGEVLMERFRPPLNALNEAAFFAIISEEPMSSINIRSNTTGMSSFFQIDHLQYGVPEPAGLTIASVLAVASVGVSCSLCARLFSDGIVGRCGWRGGVARNGSRGRGR